MGGFGGEPSSAIITLEGFLLRYILNNISFRKNNNGVNIMSEGLSDNDVKVLLGEEPSRENIVDARETAKHVRAQRSQTGGNPLIELTRSDGTIVPISVAQLAMELTLYGDDIASFCNTIGVHRRHIIRLMQENELLKAEMEESKKLLKSKTRLQLRMRDIVESFSYVIADIISDPTTDPRVAISAFTLAARMSGDLDVKDDTSGRTPPVSIVIQNMNTGTDIRPINSQENKVITLDADEYD